MMRPHTDLWRFRYWQLPELYSLELFYGRSVTFDYPQHIHEDYSFGLILRGSDTTFRQGTSFSANAGDLLLINAGEVHSSRSDGVEYRIFHISPQSLRELGHEITGGKFEDPSFAIGPTRDPILFLALLDLHLKLEKEASALERESTFLSAFALLLERHAKTIFVDSSIRKRAECVGSIKDHLRSSFAENVSLSELSSLVGLSPYYLLRSFREEVGCPPHEYQTQLRVAQAKKLILKGHSITDVALETGFFDQSHFSRNFKRIVGVTPGKYLSKSNIVQDSQFMAPVR